jgi:DNA invertase Pin-like site-specific DNA recombinase
MSTKAVSYLRVSGKAQVKGDGFTRQRAAIEKYAKSNGMTLVAEYMDKGVSGTKELEDRDGLAELLDRVQSNGVKVVLVERADRLARDLVVGEVLLRQFRDFGIRVVTADSGTDLTVDDEDPTKTLIRQVLGAVSEFEKSVIVLKLRAARNRVRKKKGRCEGRKPFGHYPGEQATLLRIKKLRRKPRGKQKTRPSYQSTADSLNTEERATRDGKPWNRGCVYAICKREGWS